MFEGCEFDNPVKNGIQSVLNTGSYRISRGKIRKRQENFGMPQTGPWVFIRAYDNRQCGKWALYHEHFQFVPTYCFNKCWKVVVRVTTINDLYKLYGVAKALNYPGKVGINRRTYVKGPYLGFFYAESEEECKAQYEDIKANLERILTKFDICYKQKCTEMEISGVGEDKEKENRLDCMFECDEDENRQAAWHINEIMQEWEHYAKMIGDETTSYTGGELEVYEAYQHRDKG